jgi:hypothetical protein
VRRSVVAVIPHTAQAYIATVDDWYWNYTFGLERTGGGRRGVVRHEDASVTVLGMIKLPKVLRDWRIAIHLLPLAEQNPQNDIVTTKRRVGWLDSYRRDKLMVAGIEFPENKLSSFLTALSVGKWKWIDIDGTPIVKRHGDIIKFAMLHDFRPGDD